MRVVKVTRYQCEWCRHTWSRRQPVEAHEPHCFKRPDRTPRVGELSSVRDGQIDEPHGWEEPGGSIPIVPPRWWPGPGCIWDGTQWLEVPGYVQATSDCGYFVTDRWPRVSEHGCTLDELPADIRLDCLSELVQ